MTLPKLFYRYDSSELPSHLSGGRSSFIKKHDLVPAHWQHKGGGPGITGFADRTALKMGQDDQGHRLLPHQKANEDHISKEEFNKRYEAMHGSDSQHSEIPGNFSFVGSIGPAVQFREETVEQFGEKEYKVVNLGGAGYAVKHKHGKYLAFYKNNGQYSWAHKEDNAAIHDSREQAHHAARAALKQNPYGWDTE